MGWNGAQLGEELQITCFLWPSYLEDDFTHDYIWPVGAK